MPFPEDVVKDAWELVEGKCECSRASHQHMNGACGKALDWEKRGQVGWGSWEACHIDGNTDHCTLSNCQILCWDCRNRPF